MEKLKATDEIYAELRYAMALYLRGEFITSCLFLAKALETLVRKNNSKDDLINILDDLRQSGKIVSATYKQLDACRKIRNRVIHERMTYEEYGQCANDFIERFAQAINYNTASLQEAIDEEDYRRLKARFTEELALENKQFTAFTEHDFRDLRAMRYAFVALKKQLEPFVQQLSPQLHFDSISNVHSFVWLAAVDTFTIDRAKIERPSLSILATTQDLRVYLDFGGRAKSYRDAYFEKLLAKGLDAELGELHRKEFMMFDTYWYSNVENIISLENFVIERDMSRFIYTKGLLHEKTEMFVQANKYKKSLSDNIFLVGKIYEKADVIIKGSAVIDEIKDAFNSLLPLYKKVVSI